MLAGGIVLHLGQAGFEGVVCVLGGGGLELDVVLSEEPVGLVGGAVVDPDELFTVIKIWTPCKCKYGPLLGLSWGIQHLQAQPTPCP